MTNTTPKTFTIKSTVSALCRSLSWRLCVASLGIGIGAVAPAFADDATPLRCGVDGSFAPHAMVKLDGTLEGFQIDLFNAAAKQMGREIIFENGEHAGMIPALVAGKYDFLCGPITVTAERSKSLVFTEPDRWSEWQFVIRDDEKLATEHDLRGKTIAVERGTPNEKWLNENSGRLDLTVLSFSGQSDAIQAVAQKRAFAYTNGSGTGTLRYVTGKVPGIKVAQFVVPGSRSSWAAPLRKDNAKLRNELEDAIACLKMNGTLAAISEKWFGEPPAADAAEVVVFPGYGTTGFEGFEDKPQAPKCQ